MFHFFAQTEPPKISPPLHRLVQHGHRLTWFTYIFACLRPTEHENLKLRPLCKLFSEILKPLPCWTSFPHLEYSTLKKLFGRFDALSRNGSTNIPKVVLIENGIHVIDETELWTNIVRINISISIVGESREHCIVLGGLIMKGKKEDDVNVSNLTLRDSKMEGVHGCYGASIHLDNVSVENSEYTGVCVFGTKRNTMKNCNVSHSKRTGVCVIDGGLMTIGGNATTIHHNCTDESYWNHSGNYGLAIFHPSSIQLVSPLTIEAISTDNGGGGNVGGRGTIAIVDNEGTIVETIQEATEDVFNDY